MIGKRFLPRTLFLRGLLIVVLPILLVQAVTAIVFYDRHWDNITRRMAYSYAGEIAYLTTQITTLENAYLRDRQLAVFSRQTDIDAQFMPGESLLALPSKGDDFTQLHDELSKRLPYPITVHRLRAAEEVAVRIGLPAGVLELRSTVKRLESGTTTIFFLWTIGSSVLFVLIAAIFLRNQVRPIRELAEAAELFGKGVETAPLKPHGAQEVRRAARAFLVMRERILRQIRSRTEMLAGISHDLRTPLTRMKLQLSLLPDLPEAREMEGDVIQMEHMIQEYLHFARGDGAEEARPVAMQPLLEAMVEGYTRTGKQVTFTQPAEVITVSLRPMAARRMVENVIENALRYGGGVACIFLRSSGVWAEIMVEDAGAGIAPANRETVFQPFTRLENSRNIATGGVGLGLSIARDIARSHGGDIRLGEAASGGLRVVIRLPL